MMIEMETGGLNPLHNYLSMPGEWCMGRLVAAMSPEMGRDKLSFPEKALESMLATAEIALLIIPTIASALLVSASFIIKEAVQLFLPSTITEFGRLYNHPEEWANIDTSTFNLGNLDAYGAGSCDYQTRGPNVPTDNPELYQPLIDNPNQDAHWASFDRPLLDAAVQNYVSHSQWEDIDRLINTMQHVGLNSLRLSPPESLYPDAEGNFNAQAIERFREILQALNNGGISVHFTCFHFTYPQYVEDSGGYLNPENCDRFVTYCKRMFQEFNPLVRAWCTINEPAVFAVQKYGRAVHAGGECNLQKMGELMVNFIKMHNQAYVEMKAMPGGTDAIIGFSHDVIHFKPHNRWNPIEVLLCSFMTNIFHRAYIEFYESGHFELSVPIPAFISYIASLFGIELPVGVHASYTDPDFKKNNSYLDRIFLQDYGIPELDLANGGPYQHPALYHPPWGCPADPFALYHGIREVYKLTGKDIEITETGCPVPKQPDDDMTLEEHQARQAEFIKNAYYTIYQAIKDGYPVRAIYVWALLGSPRIAADAIDWWEWDEGPKLLFGILNKAQHDGDRYGLTAAAIAIQEIANQIVV